MTTSPTSAARERVVDTIGGREPPKGDPRFDVPLYTVAEAARFLAFPTSTFASWAKGYDRRSEGRKAVHGAPIVTGGQGDPRIPFGGLAEGMVLAAMHRAGVSLQHIRAAVAILERELGVMHALASRRLYTDGGRLLFDYAVSAREDDLEHLTVVVSGQRVFGGVVKAYLERITYAADGWAEKVSLLRLPHQPSLHLEGASAEAGGPRRLRRVLPS